VRVSSRPLAGGRVELLVEDNGVGFDDADRAHLFAVFRTLHPRDRYPGTGIGLAMCRRIVELHGGDIDANGVPGGGAAFRVRLPVRVLHRVPERCRPISEPA
jgi:signal transduction histidine kinase